MRSKCISVASCLGVLSRVNKRRKWTAGKWHFLPCSKQKFNIAIICHARKMSLMIVQPLLKYLCDVCGFYFSPASERQLWITEHNFNELTVKWIFSCSFRQGEWEFITLMFFQLVVFKGKANPSRGLTDKERKMSKFLFSRFFLNVEASSWRWFIISRILNTSKKRNYWFQFLVHCYVNAKNV